MATSPKSYEEHILSFLNGFLQFLTKSLNTQCSRMPNITVQINWVCYCTDADADAEADADADADADGDAHAHAHAHCAHRDYVCYEHEQKLNYWTCTWPCSWTSSLNLALHLDHRTLRCSY